MIFGGFLSVVATFHMESILAASPQDSNQVDCLFVERFLQIEKFHGAEKEMLVFGREICPDRGFWRGRTSSKKPTGGLAFQKCGINKLEENQVASGTGYSVILFLCETSITVKMLNNFNTANKSVKFMKIFVRVPPGENLMKQLKDLRGVDKFIAIEDESDQVLRIFQISRPLEKGLWVTTLIAEINTRFFNAIINGDSQKVLRENYKFNLQPFSEASLSNFVGQSVRVAAVMNSNYEFDTNIQVIQSAGNTSYKFLPSFAVDLLRCLEYTLKFRTIPKVATSWGHELDSKWEGMIGLLVNDEADLAISSTADLPFRRAAVDFNFPTFEIRLCVFFRRPPFYVLANPLTRPFNTDLWTAFLVTVFILAVSLAVVTQSVQNSSSVKVGTCRWSKVDCFQWTLSTVCFNGTYVIPASVPIRLIVSTTLFLSVVIGAVYGGTLLSFLFVQVEPINTLDELLSTDFKFDVIDDPISIKNLVESKNAEDVKIYERRIKGRKTKSMKEVVEELKRGSFVAVLDLLNGYQTLEQDFSYEEACQMREFVIGQSQQKQGTMVRKGSSLRRIIDNKILEMSEFGLVKRWERAYINRKILCESTRTFDGIRMESIQSALACFAGATFISILIFIVEFSKDQIMKLF